jgi:hypothetical protein
MREVIDILFPYIVLLYIIDSIQYIHHYHLHFVTIFGSRYKLKNRGIHFFQFSPISKTILSYKFPFPITGLGLYFLRNFDSDHKELHNPEDFQYISYKNIEVIETDGKVVKINNKNLLKMPSAMSAKYIVSLIHDLMAETIEIRNNRIEQLLTKKNDIKEIKKLQENYSNYFFFIRMLSSFLFINIFILLPLILYTDLYLYMNIFGITVNIALFYLIIVITTYIIHRRLYNDERKQRVLNILSIILSPVSAMHAINYLCKDMFIKFDYLAIASQLLPLEDFQSLIKKKLYYIDHLISQSSENDWIEYWKMKKKALLNLIDSQGVSLGNILAIPKKRDETAILYCPFCMTEYRNRHEICSDCGVGLKRFE